MANNKLITPSLNAQHLDTFSFLIKANGYLPKNIEVSAWSDWYLISCYDNKNAFFISESVAMGIDKDRNIACLKALTEFCERKIIKQSEDPDSKITVRTDGFAAYPVYNRNFEESYAMARKNAFCEAVERFAWSTWWDNKEIKHQFKSESGRPEFKELIKNFDVESLNSINISTSCNLNLLILIAKLGNFGYVTGGAAGELSSMDESLVYTRAFGELLRHLIAYKKMMNFREINSYSYYENRLFGFASGKWNYLVEERLSKVGKNDVNLPKLKIDKRFVHDAEKIVTLHRCLFENQPIFMGGDVARLCI